MLTSEGCSARRRQLWERIPEPCELIVLTDPASLTYFAGYAPSLFSFRAAEAAAVLVLTRERSILHGDNLLRPDLERSWVDEIHAPLWYNGRRSAGHRKAQLLDAVREQTMNPGLHRIGIEASSAPIGLLDRFRETFPNLECLDLDPVIRTLRRTKQRDEVALLRQCLAASDAAMAAALQDVRPGMTELDVFLLVQNVAIATAGEPVLVYGDFVSGPRTENVGGPPTHRTIAAGDPLILDFSVVRQGYRSDVASSMIVGAEPTEAQRRLQAICLEALEAGEALLKPGVAGREIDAAVRSLLHARSASEHFQGHVGHGIGLGHPEPPFLVPDSQDILMPGDVVTLEPGLYVNGLAGMRFEHNYLITDDGFERLSDHRLTLTA